jgi:hypothetical protein
MPVSNRETLESEVRETAKRFSGRTDLPDLRSKIGEDLGIDDLEYYDFLSELGRQYGIDLLKSLEIRAPMKVTPWSLRSLGQALRQPGLIEDPTLERLVELIDSHRQA